MKLTHYLLLLLLVSLRSFADGIDIWEQLLPENERQMAMPEINHDAPLGEASQQNLNVSVNPELDGQSLRIPGFVVPLDSEGEVVKEFLLVPYFGACIHVPPPPANQIVYVKFSKGVPIHNIQDAIWVTGTLSTKGWQGDLATVGYSLSGVKISPYDG